MDQSKNVQNIVQIIESGYRNNPPSVNYLPVDSPILVKIREVYSYGKSWMDIHVLFEEEEMEKWYKEFENIKINGTVPETYRIVEIMYFSP